MCIGITVLTMPPTVAALGYLSWFQGSNLYGSVVLHQSQPEKIRDNSGWSPTTVGLLATPLMYSAQAKLIFPLLESKGQGQDLKRHALSTKPHRIASLSNTNSVKKTSTRPPQYLVKVSSQAQTGYVPPESMMELAKNVGPPLMIRIAATTVAFGVGGAIQMQVAHWLQD